MSGILDNYPAERYFDEFEKDEREECKRCKGNCGYIGMIGVWACHGFIPKTNADRIRSMTNEELAEFLLRKEHHCPGGSISNNCVGHETCEGCWLDWLKQEAKE